MRKNTLIFCGPTISETEATQYLDAVYLPPAKQGDIYQYYQQYKPKIIGIIDGFFENTASPWHKEILFAMDQGVHVYGASSMGALRAAELSDFGMKGIGKIFRAYQSEDLQDDDEVAVIHGPENIGYPKLSEAMVNIRATLELAKQSNIISDSLCIKLIEFAKKTFYKNRNYGLLIQNFAKKEKYRREIETFSNWLHENAIDLKKSDAIEMLKAINAHIDESLKPNETMFYFEQTVIWSKMCQEIDGSART